MKLLRGKIKLFIINLISINSLCSSGPIDVPKSVADEVSSADGDKETKIRK